MRYWTESEARAELPRLRLLVDAVQRGVRQASVARTNGHSVPQNGTGPYGGTRHAGSGDDPGSAAGEAVDVQAALAELAEKGIMLRDADAGLVDFPAVTGAGKIYLLCWKRDEADLGWWHFAEEGFAGRKPLPVPTDL